LDKLCTFFCFIC